MSEAKIRPLRNRVVVQEIKVDAVTKGGIVLPGDSEDQPCEGIVIAVGKGAYDADGELVPMSLSVGDKILYGEHAGHKVDVDGTEFFIIAEDEITAIII